MREATIKLYQFNELSEEAQKKVIENMQKDDSFLMYDWYEYVFEIFKEDMYKKYSCDVRDIFFSGFWSQGDGASFTGRIFIKDYLEATKQKSKYRSLWKYLEEYEPNIDIGQSGHYSHENTMYFNDHSFYEGTEKQQEQLYKIMEEIEDTFREEARQLYRELEQEYEYLTSDECIKEEIINAEYEFYADGTQPNF